MLNLGIESIRQTRAFDIEMCCIDDDYRKNAGLAGIFDFSTGCAMIVLVYFFMAGIPNFESEYVNLILYLDASLIILSAFVGLIYSYRLIDILRRDRPLRFISWTLLAISFAIQPVAIYFVATTIQMNHPDLNRGKQIGNYTAKEEFAPIFYALCGLHCILALNMACAYRDAYHEMEYYLADAKFAEMRRREEEEGFYDDNREDMTLSRNKPRQNGLSRDKNMSSDSVFDEEDENRQLVPEVYDEMPLMDRQPVALDQSVYRSIPSTTNQPTNKVNLEHPKDEVFIKSDLAMSIRSLRSNKAPRQISDSLNSGLTEEEMKSIETISSEKHMFNHSNDNMHTKVRTSASNVNKLRTPINALSSTARSLPSRRNTSKMSRNSLDILNPTLYHKVKSIEIELGASDDEDILDKSIKVQTAFSSRKQ